MNRKSVIDIEDLEIITYRDITKEQAKMKGKKRVSADEISDVLRIDMTLVNETLHELWHEGWVEPE